MTSWNSVDISCSEWLDTGNPYRFAPPMDGPSNFRASWSIPLLAPLFYRFPGVWSFGAEKEAKKTKALLLVASCCLFGQEGTGSPSTTSRTGLSLASRPRSCLAHGEISNLWPSGMIQRIQTKTEINALGHKPVSKWPSRDINVAEDVDI